MEGIWVAPVGTKLGSDGWTNIGHSFAEMRLALDKVTEAAGAAARSIETCSKGTQTFEFRLAQTPGLKYFQLVFGMSRREFRIFRGIERKQLLHKGRKP